MGIEIRSIEASSSLETYPIQKSLNLEHLYSGSLLSISKENDRFEKTGNFFTRTLTWFVDIFKWILSKICCGCFKTGDLQVELYKQNLEKIERLIQEFPEKKKNPGQQGANLKEWWLGEFNSLTTEVQRNILWQDILLHDNGNEPRESLWRDWETTSRDYVVYLEKQNFGGKSYDPKEDLPTYLKDSKKWLEEEIKKLQGPQKRKEFGLSHWIYH